MPIQHILIIRILHYFCKEYYIECDYEGRKLKIIMDDIGICISTDPVAIDKACYDLVAKNDKKFRGHKQLIYAEKIGLGSTKYDLILV